MVVGVIAGGIQGALGAKLQCGSPRDIVVAALAGAALGGLVGSADLTEGVGTLMILGGAAGFEGDAAGQAIGDIFTGRSDFNFGSLAGATVGGVVAGAAGGVLGTLGAAAGLPEMPVTAGGASIGGGIGISSAGAVAGDPNMCGCKK